MWAYRIECHTCTAAAALAATTEAAAEIEAKELGWQVDTKEMTDLYDNPVGAVTTVACPDCVKRYIRLG